METGPILLKIKFNNSFSVQHPLIVIKFIWIVFTNGNIDSRLYIPYNCKFLTAQTSHDNEYLVEETYYVKSAGPISLNFGIWSNTTGLVTNIQFQTQRKNLRGISLIRTDLDVEFVSAYVYIYFKQKL